MTSSGWRATWAREIKVLLWFILASVIQSYFMCARCSTFRSYFTVFLFTLSLWYFLWRGNGYLASYISRRISWIEFPVKRLLIGLVTTVGYTCGSLFLLMTVFERWADFNFGRGYYPTLYSSVIVTLLISLFLHSKYFLEFWRKSVLDAERFKKESMRAKYELLKTSFNPQLLFESFQSLRAMVSTDKEMAVRFIKQLSDAYRYILDSRDREIVAFETELRFLKAYVFLLESRHAGRLTVDLSFSTTDFHVSPLAFQLLIDAAVCDAELHKNSNHLHVAFSDKEHGAVMKLSGDPLTFQKGQLSHVVEALRDRYRFLSHEEVVFHFGSEEVSVKLPFISTDYKTAHAVT